MKISFQNVTKKYGSVCALNDISLDIADGEMFFLLGPSGCGKTTLLRCLGGFEQPTTGRVVIGEKDATGLPPNLRDTAMAFQGYALFPHLTVEENIRFGLEMQKLPKDEIARRTQEAMAVVQIEALAKRHPNELSGGQQQRVALARTMVVRPGCMLLDEPLANLDAKLRREMRTEIRRICKAAGLTVLYVTHDRQEALAMADRIAVLKDGRIRQVGTPQEIYRHPKDAFVANFIGEANFLDGVVAEVSNGQTVVETAVGKLVSADVSWSKGTAVKVSIRPEALEPVRQGMTYANTLSVVIRQTEYLGELSDQIAEAADGIELKYFELNPRVALEPGQKVSVAVQPEDVVLLPMGEC